MSPNEIRAAPGQSHGELVVVERHNPDGWSFFLGQPRSGTKSNRILRATRSSAGAVTQIKMAVSSRHYSKEKKVRFGGNADALRKLVESEVRLYRKHFAERDGQ
jgi:hypothetical protein